MPSVLKHVNLALRGLMELGIVAAMAYWGYHAGNGVGMKVLLCIAAPLLTFGFWGVVDFRQAGRMAEPLRLIQELLISAGAAVALYTAGRHVLAWALVLVSIIHHVLVYLLGDTLLKRIG